MVEPAAGSGAAHLHAAADVGEDVTPPRRSVAARLVARGQALLAWWQQTRPARANARFGERGGGVLTGGIAYAALFSVFAALTIGWTIFMAVLGGNDELREQVLEAIDSALPGLVQTSPGDEGLVDPTTLRLSAGLTAAGVVAFVVLLISALSATAALRTGVRAMFADEGGGGGLVLGKLRELGGLAGLALAVLVSAVLTTGVAGAVQWVLRELGWSGATTVAVGVAGALVAFVVDAAVFVLVVRVLAGITPPRPDLLRGAVISAVGVGVVRVLGTSVVAGSATKNPLLASFAVIVTLLVWVNLIARIVLLAAAWTANPPPRPPAGQPAAS
ncbi:YihY/virulence factor BrkB family protein [Cellulomonas persica]|uniref:Uncharacterized protein n=1 Tax=Cellulomonas persica TaxID=76861 RepID=A0A510UU12_9CELL|nr:YhjD/YihY/BrkB family envelope integrity protein [Cellulomonas persica]GEK17986.1 hypothetical protein CPE01_17190 [Cellulomonas persica]